MPPGPAACSSAGVSIGEVLRTLELILECAHEGELEGVIEYIPF